MVRPVDSYVICTSPRSGSTLLCGLLASTGLAGNPGSWFHRPSLDEWARGLGVADEEKRGDAYVSKLLRAGHAQGTGTSNVFGLRLQRDSFDFFFETLRRIAPPGSSDVVSFERFFGSTRFIHLSRADKVEQAISCVRAEQSGLWHVAADGSELERVAPHSDPYYDPVAIQSQVESFTAFDLGWDAWFSQERIEPLRISYTELAYDPASTTREVLAHLGLDPDAADGVEPGVRKMADATNDEWVKRFRAERSRSSKSSS